MADGDSPTIRVELRVVDIELAYAGEHLGTERLVDFDTVDVGELQARGREQRLDRIHRADAHVLRRYAHGHAGQDACERRHLQLLQVIARGDEHTSRAVDDGRAVTA